MLDSMKVAVAGASGFIGRALARRLAETGDEVVRFVRRPAETPDEISWHPVGGQVEQWDRLEGVGAVVNLVGSNLAAGRWTEERKEEILRSRVEGTRTLVATMTRMNHHPRAFVSASAVGYYGDRGDEELTEDSTAGEGFLSQVCRAWEGEARIAASAGIRTVRLRIGPVLGRGGGALARMLPLFHAGLGGRLGSGRQWVSWISLDDVVEAILLGVRDPQLDGAVNAVAPQPVRNAELAVALGRVLGRPALIPAPAAALRALYGEMADEALLASTRVVPQSLLAVHFTFQFGGLESALRKAVGAAAPAESG